MRGTDLYKYSREGRETASTSLAPLPLEIWPLAMDGALEQSFCEGFLRIKGTT